MNTIDPNPIKANNVSSFSDIRLTEGQEEKWLNVVLIAIKESIPNQVSQIISKKIDQLNDFSPESIVKIVDKVHAALVQRQDLQDLDKCFKAAACQVMIKKGIHQFSFKNSSWLFMHMAIESIKNGKNVFQTLEKFPFAKSTPEGQKTLIEIARIEAFRAKSSISEYIKHYGIDLSSSETQKAMIEIAKLAAYKDGKGVSKYIQNYGIDKSTPEGQNALIEIAKIAAKYERRGISEYILKYGIDCTSKEGLAGLVEIAKLSAQIDGLATSREIKNYSIVNSTPDGQAALIEIAKLAAQQSGLGTSAFIQNYGIDSVTKEGQKAFIEIAKLAAQQSGRGVSTYIKNYGIDPMSPEGKIAYVEIAKLAANENGAGTSALIHNYHIDNNTEIGQTTLIEIAQIAAKQNGGGTSEHIQNYGIDDATLKGQLALIEIAKLAAMQNGRETSEFIRKYRINKHTQEGQKALMEIAKRAAQQNGETSRYIHLYGIDSRTTQGQAALIEIAKLAVQNDAQNTCYYISNYALNNSTKEGQAGLIEIAKLAAQTDGSATSGRIKLFGIDKFPNGQQALIEIAKLAAAQNGEQTSRYIQNYSIDHSTAEGQKGLIEIAKIAAHKDGGGTSEHILGYTIPSWTVEGQKALMEIAKIAAQQDGSGTSENISKYLLDESTTEGQSALIEIAKLAAQQCGWGLSKHIQNYSIDHSTAEGQKGLIEIAKIAAHKDGGGTSEHILGYTIPSWTVEGQKALMEIAKIAAQQDGSGTSENISKYLLDESTTEGQSALIEIAKLAAQQCGWGLSKHIQNYKIKGQIALMEIAQLAVKQDASGTLMYIDNYAFNGDSSSVQKACLDLSDLVFIQILLQSQVFSIQEFHRKLHDFKCSSLAKKGFSSYNVELGECFFKLSHRFEKDSLQDVAKECFTLCEKEFSLSKENLRWVMDRLNKKTEEPFNQKRFLEWFICTAALCCMRKDLRELFKEQKTLKEISKSDPRLREALTKEFIYLSYSQNQGNWINLRETSEGIVHAEPACLVLANFPSKEKEEVIQAVHRLKSERGFKERNNQKLLLETLLKIKNSSLEVEQKKRLVKMLFLLPFEERLQGFRLVQDLIFFKGESYFDAINNSKELHAALESLFQKEFEVNLEHFSDKYRKTIGLWRSKEALITYAGKLNELPPYEKKIAFELFKNCLKNILEGNFQKARYSLDKNPHLAQIKENYSHVYDKWQNGVELNTEELVNSLDVKEVPISEKMVITLKEALIQKHLGGINQASLYPDLTDFIEKNVNLDKSLSNIIDKLALLSSRTLTGEEMKTRNRLLIEKALLGIFKSTEELEKKLIDLKSCLSKQTELYNDVEGFLRLLKMSSRAKQPKNFSVIDTDDPNHILLMGTEVQNSCQRVDGQANLNKCLLAYFLDGKHRLGLICDSQGKIYARMVLRLLIDAEGRPVLYQEKLYVADVNPEWGPLLRKLARKKADSLGIPLVGSKANFENHTENKYPNILYAKGKPVPFEYVDALLEIQSGRYEIHDAINLNTNF